jgi:hypothetical protein
MKCAGIEYNNERRLQVKRRLEACIQAHSKDIAYHTNEVCSVEENNGTQAFILYSAIEPLTHLKSQFKLLTSCIPIRQL